MLVVADGKGDSDVDGVKIIDAGKFNGRLQRIFKASEAVFRKGLEVDASIYHLHDPELLPVALKLKRLGKVVVFDAHEDFPAQLRTKPYLHPIVSRILGTAASWYESYAFKRLDGLIAATPKIGEKLVKSNRSTEVINNFPILEELSIPDSGQTSFGSGGVASKEIAYVGGITEIRGITQLIAALDLVKSDIRLNLVGKFLRQEFSLEARQYPGWRKVNEYGFLDRKGVAECLSRSIAGVVTFLGVPNHVNSQPNKMFEYMSAGIPVIASDFPLWREIVEGNQCGLCVDPTDPASIARAIDMLASDPGLCRDFGENGKRAVLTKYNWSAEERKLLNFYKELAQRARAKDGT